jgi:hypothetical protein
MNIERLEKEVKFLENFLPILIFIICIAAAIWLI